MEFQVRQDECLEQSQWLDPSLAQEEIGSEFIANIEELNEAELANGVMSKSFCY